ncbi:Amidase 2 domain containing protein [Asbolus verrucosus]|uniref:Amidase 2 domain containing protein n=1 Tax=Asbolus verrucosus TaxID=1661398 RepID=A0A482VH25_ASBVE|nr:Amidase 2 domain containing protein [Asbolus verrucosus]
MSNQFTVAQEKTFILPYYNDNQITLGEGHEIIQRLEWGGQPPLKRKKLLHHPVELVITAHTVTDFCTTIAECSTIVAAIQNYHFTLKKSDITYNFLIGGDGNVYVGRGWDVVNPFRNQSIVISFIGNYLSDQLKEDMIDAAQMLLLQGVEFGKLAENYTIVCHNQTKATLSPGTNVYKIVKTWPHYSPDKIH